MDDRTGHRDRVEERRQQILAVARERAEEAGWDAVTTRHLAQAIGYSQPVLYGHFPGGKTEIMREVALMGFAELAVACREAVGEETGRRAVAAVATAYLDFAARNAAVYEAMFQQPIGARFAQVDAEPELRGGFEALGAALADEQARATATEILWSALHGMSLLERAGRVPLEHQEDRIRDLARRFS